MEKILIIDDDVELCELVKRYLTFEGFEVEVVHDGAQGVSVATHASAQYALLVLDVMLPSLSGFEVLRRVREKSSVPVLMLTARGEETDRIVGLEIGADDYLSKPFNPRELLARIRAVLRRAQAQVAVPVAVEPVSDRIKSGDVEVDPGARVARRSGEGIELTGAEFDLLVTLLKHVGHVITREDLVRVVLGRALTSYDRSIDTLVSNLRRKLGPLSHGGERIKSVRGIGYIYVSSE